MNAPGTVRRRTCMAVLAIAAACSAGAQSLDVTRHIIANGGGSSNGGSYRLTGTIGQAEAVPRASGGTFVLYGGWWPAPAGSQAEVLFRDGFESP